MKFFKIPILLLSLFLFIPNVSAQNTELTVSFSEQFFDALLDAVFQYAAPPEFPLSENKQQRENATAERLANSFAERVVCNESVKILRENNGVRTRVKFQQGQIIAPIAFSGNYSPPLIGCVAFTGLADAVIGLEFDQQGQRLLARARVQNVSLNGTGGIGGSLVAKMVQGAIDKKINPIEIIQTEKASFVVPMKNSRGLKMKATGFTSEVTNGQLNVRIAYKFEPGN